MANVTRIKAKDPKKKQEKQPEQPAEVDKKAKKLAKKAEKAAQKPKKPMSAPVRFITWPFRYIHESWVELRQVRWPSRKAAWKMVLAVIIYTAILITVIMLLDALFTLLFNQLLA